MQSVKLINFNLDIQTLFRFLQFQLKNEVLRKSLFEAATSPLHTYGSENGKLILDKK